MQYYIFFCTGSHIRDVDYELYAAATPEGIAEATRRVYACAHNDYYNFEAISPALAKALSGGAISLDDIVHSGCVIPEVNACHSIEELEGGDTVC